jgi:hypothetical protein
MLRRLLAAVCGLALLVAVAAPARAIQDAEERPLPLTPAKCGILIDQGAPFALVALGGPDTAEACIIIIGGAPR